MLFICLLINWSCAFIVFDDKPHKKKKQLRRTRTGRKHFAHLEYEGGRVIMALTNTLMMVQTGFPTGVCEVRSRENYL